MLNVVLHFFDTADLKPAAALVSARRTGMTGTLDQLNKYFVPFCAHEGSG